MSLVRDLAEALDPVVLAARCGFRADAWQADVLRSTAPYLALCCSRQVGKSTTAGHKAVHVALFEPGALVLMVSPSQRQSQELFRAALAVYRKLGRPVDSTAENALSLALENGSRIVSLPGDEKTIRGYSAPRLVIVDEAARVPDEILDAVRPMLAVSAGQLVALSTPFGRRGWFHAAVTDPRSGWDVVQVKATDCPRISAEFLAAEREALGDWRFRQEYACEFVDNASAYFSGEDIAKMFSTDVQALGPDTPAAGRHLRVVAA